MDNNNTVDKVKLEKARNITKGISGFLSLLVVISFLTICASPFVFIWATFVLSLKVLGTGVCGVAIFKFLSFILSNSMKKVEEDLKQKSETTV